jgi:hypothetical protein
MSDSQVYGNEVKITDANGDPFVADPTGAFATTTELQEAIHRGDAYSFDVDGTIGIDTSIYFVGIIGGKQIHFDNLLLYLEKGDIKLWIYESPTLTDNGTQQTPINMNFASGNTSVLSLYSDPTITDNGTKKVSTYFPLSGGGANTSPEKGSIASGRVLKANTTYLFRLQNLDNSSCDFGINFIWHDSDYILG